MDGRPIRPKGIQQSDIPAYEGFGSELDDDFLDTLDAQGRVTTIDENDNPIIAPPQQVPFSSGPFDPESSNFELRPQVIQTSIPPNVNAFNPPPAPRRPTPPPVPVSRAQQRGEKDLTQAMQASKMRSTFDDIESTGIPGAQPPDLPVSDPSDGGLLAIIKRMLQQTNTLRQ